MPILSYLDYRPRIDGHLQLADDAVIIGQVTLLGPAVVTARAVIRGDQAPIDIGPDFHLGQRSTIHVDPQTPTHIGSGVWIGAAAVAHGCTLGDQVRVGPTALILSRSQIGAGSIVAAGALVTEGAVFPPHSYIAGSPGRRVRDVTPEERADFLPG